MRLVSTESGMATIIAPAIGASQHAHGREERREHDLEVGARKQAQAAAVLARILEKQKRNGEELWHEEEHGSGAEQPDRPREVPRRPQRKKLPRRHEIARRHEYVHSEKRGRQRQDER